MTPPIAISRPILLDNVHSKSYIRVWETSRDEVRL